MAVYVDTSAFLKLVVKERESAALRRTVLGRQLASSALLRTEALRAARSHSTAALARTRQTLDAVTLIAVTDALCERAAELDPSIMRSLDALHVASALLLGDDLEAVLTYDARMAAACELVGVSVLAPV